MARDPIALNFMDALLHESDVNLLKGPHWLNDNIITFYFEYLEKSAYKGVSELLFIGPEVVQCLKAAEKTELEIFLQPLAAKEKQFIFLALNDNEILDKAGGWHWSLLVYSKPEQAFFHLDSMQGSNYGQATKLAGKLLSYLTPTGKGDFTEEDTLQQRNCYDCGIFVLCEVDELVKYCLENKKISGCDIISEAEVKTKRNDILKLIQELKGKGNLTKI